MGFVTTVGEEPRDIQAFNRGLDSLRDAEKLVAQRAEAYRQRVTRLRDMFLRLGAEALDDLRDEHARAEALNLAIHEFELADSMQEQVGREVARLALLVSEEKQSGQLRPGETLTSTVQHRLDDEKAAAKSRVADQRRNLADIKQALAEKQAELAKFRGKP